jgi:hypothetical protein
MELATKWCDGHVFLPKVQCFDRSRGLEMPGWKLTSLEGDVLMNSEVGEVVSDALGKPSR